MPTKGTRTKTDPLAHLDGLTVSPSATLGLASRFIFWTCIADEYAQAASFLDGSDSSWDGTLKYLSPDERSVAMHCCSMSL